MQYNYGFSVVQAESKLALNLTINPDKVNLGDTASLTASIKKEGNSATTINSLEIISPWQNKKELDPTVLLNSNRIYTTSMPVTIPEETRPGQYDLTVRVITNDSD